MNTLLRYRDDELAAGMTMKDGTAPEENNMALHACADPEAVLQNRRKLAAALGCSLTDFVCARQTHSANVHKVTAADRGRGAEQAATAIPDTDALYTYESGLILGCFTADCVPVLFYDETKGLIGVIHSGWQGTVKEITSAVLKRLSEEEDCQPADLHIHLGPALSQERFEVDEDVYLKYKALGYADSFMYYKEETGKYHIDNQLTVKEQCLRAGVPEDRITVDRICTFQSPHGFSYRQDKACGRHMAFIMKR